MIATLLQIGKKHGLSYSVDAKVKVDRLILSHKTVDILLAVDLTTGDPWSGTFVVPQSGRWRFTFNPRVGLDSSGNAHYSLKVDGVTAARSRIDAGLGTAGTFMMVMNTIWIWIHLWKQQ